MRIEKLKLTNFKGIKSLQLDLAGESASIYGANATGKTTIYDSFLWLLFGKDSANRADFAIKALTEDGAPISGLDHEVEAVLSIGDTEVALKKSFKEKWTKRRGSATAEFTGHTTDYYIDGVPAKKAEYDAKIAEIADESVFKLLTSPAYFNEQLHLQDRRALLLEVCGDISDADVIASDEALSALPSILGKRSLEDHRKVIQARRTEINRELERVPVRIDEAMRGLPDVEGLDEVALRAELDELRAKRTQLQTEQVRITSGGEVAERTKHLRELEAELITAQSRVRAATEEQLAEHRATLRQAQADAENKRREISRAEADAQATSAEIEQLRRQMAALRKQWHEANATAFEHTDETVCPTCGQDIPEEQLNEARQQALAVFNLQKAGQLEELSAEGKRKAARVTELEAAQAERQRGLEAAKAALATLQDIAVTAQAQIDAAKAAEPDPSRDAECRKLTSEIAKAKESITELQQGQGAALAGVQDALRKLNTKVEAVEASLATIGQRTKGLERIEELKAEERQLAGEYEQLEGELYLTEEFVRTKVRMLEQRINSKFTLARFKLFEVQVNGALNEVCETTYQGVPYSAGLNNAARINVGLDIIRTLSEHYGFSAPIFVDNAEAVVELLPIDAQVIRLVVSGEDKVLRVECCRGARTLQATGNGRLF